jgi:hypothetical protein
MKNEKNTDDIIRKKLENFQVTPPQHIWDNVQRQLAAQRRRNRMFYTGWISAAAVVVLAFLAGWYFNQNLKIENSAAINKEVIQPENSSNESTIQSEKSTVENLSSTAIDKNNSNQLNNSLTNQFAEISSVNSKTALVKTDAPKNNSTSREIYSMEMLESANVTVAQNQETKTLLARHTKIIQVKTLTELDQILIAENIKNIKKAEKPDNNWKMGMYIAPGYSSYSASHSESYSQNITYSGSDGNANVSGGFSVQYKTSKRWIVESGVYYAQNGQQSENSANLFALNRNEDLAFAPDELTYFSNEVRVENNNLAMNSTAGVIQFNGTPKGAELTGDFEATKTGVANLLVPNGEFSQVFEFMEIPLYLRYRLVDSNLGIELITGLSAGVIVGNNAYIDNQYGLQNIGETEDISSVNLSGTLGMAVNYALGKHFSVAVEPRFNYYLNSINTNPSVDFRPYRIGFYTGVTYEF